MPWIVACFWKFWLVMAFESQLILCHGTALLRSAQFSSSSITSGTAAPWNIHSAFYSSVFFNTPGRTVIWRVCIQLQPLLWDKLVPGKLTLVWKLMSIYSHCSLCARGIYLKSHEAASPKWEDIFYTTLWICSLFLTLFLSCWDAHWLLLRCPCLINPVLVCLSPSTSAVLVPFSLCCLVGAVVLFSEQGRLKGLEKYTMHLPTWFMAIRLGPDLGAHQHWWLDLQWFTLISTHK